MKRFNNEKLEVSGFTYAKISDRAMVNYL